MNKHMELITSTDISVPGLEYSLGELSNQPNVFDWAKHHSSSKQKKSRKKKKHRNYDNNKSELSYPIFQNPIVHYQMQKFDSAFAARRGENIPSAMIFSSEHDSGVVFGYANDLDGQKQLVGKRAEIDGHIAVFGGSGSGKTTGIAAPTCAAWKSPIFMFDFKGDLLKYRKRTDAKVLYLLSGKENAFYYDPFMLLRKDGKDTLVSNARELANAILPLPLNIREPFWIQGARDILTGAIIYCFHLGMNFIETMKSIKTTGLSQLLNEIFTDDLASVCVNLDVILNPRMLAGISEELHQHLTVFATDEIIKNALSNSSASPKDPLHWEDLEHSDIIIRLDMGRIEQWSSVVRLMLTQLIRTLERRPEMYSPQGFSIKPTLLLLDELPQYGKIEEIASSLKILRSKNVTFALFMQSLADLDEVYGMNTRRAILDNCPYQAILSAQDAETQQYFSSRIGVDSFPSSSITASYTQKGNYCGYNASITETLQPIVFPQEFAALTNVVLLHPWPGGFCRVNKILPEQQRTTPKLCVDIER